jgi:hypothetical protein
MEMTRVTILPVSGASDEKSYYAVAGDKQSFGQTAGEALDALTEQLAEDETNTLVIVQNLRPDTFFTAAQQQQLAELMERWRLARDQNQSLSADEQSALDRLIEAELLASAARTIAILDDLSQ